MEKVKLKNSNKWSVVVLIVLVLCSCIAGEHDESGVLIAENLLTFTEWPEDVTGALAGSVRFDCRVQEKADVSIKWLKNGTILENERSSSLILRDLNWAHRGSYQCAVSFVQGTVLSCPGTLRLSQAPKFAVEPQDLSARIGGVARFRCAAKAEPPALFSWLHNGLPLGDIRNTRFRTLDSGILHIRDVQTSDEGSYLCIASNPVGNATSRSATLSTTSNDVPQSSLKVLAAPLNQTVVSGSDALLECLIDSDPAPQIKWQRLSDGTVNRERMELIGTNLKIRNVEPSDEGFYACIATIKDKEPVNYKVFLSVSYAPTIKEKPEVQKKKRGETARFICFSDANPPPSIHWYKNGERVDPRGRLKLFPSDSEPVERITTPQGGIQFKRDLVISSVQPEDAGIYQCFSSNGVGVVSAAAELNVSVDNLNVSNDAPKNLRAHVEPLLRRVRLEWEAPSQFPADDLAVYLIHFDKNDGKGENTHPATDACDESGHCQAYCCATVELEPHKNYSFRVSGLYSGPPPVFSPLSNQAEVKIWDGVAKGVASLTVHGLPEGGVKLEWEIPSATIVPGQLKEFRIEYRREDDPKVRTARVPYLIQEHTLMGLTPKATYYFRVIPKTRAGYPSNLGDSRFPWTSQVIHGPPEGGMDIPAPDMEVRPLNSTSVLLTWTPVGDMKIVTFAIKHQLQTDGGPIKELKVSGEKRKLVIHDLAPGSLYEVSVAGVTSDGRPGLDSSRMVRTLDAAEESTTAIGQRPVVIRVPPPLTVWCEKTGKSDVLKVKWTPPPTDRSVERFQVRYSPVPDKPGALLNASLVSYVEKKTRELNVKLAFPKAVYTFAVKSFDKFNYTGPYSEEFVCESDQRTNAAIPTGSTDNLLLGAPRNLEVDILNGSSVRVRWEPPTETIRDGESRNGSLVEEGEIITYLVQVTQNRHGNKWKESLVNGSQTSVVLTGLTNTVYYVKVSAINDGGRGQNSEVIAVSGGVSGTSTTTIVVEKVSYKEGMIAGGVIALVCILLCLLVLYCRIKHEGHYGELPSGWWGHFGRLHPRESTRKDNKQNGHVPNGTVTEVGESQEMQELLPHTVREVEVNPECDSKGGVDGVQPRCSRILRQTAPHIHTLTLDGIPSYADQNGFLHHGEDGSHTEDLMVTVIGNGDICRGDDPGGGVEMSSDLSHSPAATASSLHSWNQEDGLPHHTSAISMPNLADSGFGFDENSVRLVHCGLCGGGNGIVQKNEHLRRGTAA